MTPKQRGCVERAASYEGWTLSAETCAAVEALLVERDALLAACEALVDEWDVNEDSYDYARVTGLFATLREMIAEAKEG